jgi:hypothetical protein
MASAPVQPTGTAAGDEVQAPGGRRNVSFGMGRHETSVSGARRGRGTESLLDIDQVRVEVARGLSLDETDSRVEGRVPRHIGVGPQTQALVPTTTSLLHRGFNKHPPVPAPTMLGQYRKLFQMSDPVTLKNVHEPNDGARLMFLSDQDEPMIRCSRYTRRSRLPTVGAQPVDEQSIRAILNRLEREVIGVHCVTN